MLLSFECSVHPLCGDKWEFKFLLFVFSSKTNTCTKRKLCWGLYWFLCVCLLCVSLDNTVYLSICPDDTSVSPLCHVSVFLSLCPHVQMKLMKLLQRLPASVVRRLHRERYRKPTWQTQIPESHKLTEEDITVFVESMMQPVLLAMFSKTGSLDAAQALQNLALMRPELVIPPVLEKCVL